MPFAKGQSGNPGARPKGVKEVQETARAHTKLAIDTLASIARDPKQGASARVSAADVLLERGWGKAPQTIEIDGLNKLPDHVIDAILSVCDAIDAGQVVAAGPARNGSGDLSPEGATSH